MRRSRGSNERTMQIILGAVVGAVVALCGLWLLFTLAGGRADTDSLAANNGVSNDSEESNAKNSDADGPQDQPAADQEPSRTESANEGQSRDERATGESTGNAVAPSPTTAGEATNSDNSRVSPPPNEAVTTSPPAEPSKTPRGLQPGLMKVAFYRHAQQKGPKLFAPFNELGKAISPPEPITEIRNWTYAGGKNGAAVGLLKIEEPGEYVFKTYNYYDRNVLYVGKDIVCPFRGSVRGGSDGGTVAKSKERVQLETGYVPIIALGFVDARNSMQVLWRPPSKTDYEPIPASNLWHDPSWTYDNAADIWSHVLSN